MLSATVRCSFGLKGTWPGCRRNKAGLCRKNAFRPGLLSGDAYQAPPGFPDRGSMGAARAGSEISVFFVQFRDRQRLGVRNSDRPHQVPFFGTMVVAVVVMPQG